MSESNVVCGEELYADFQANLAELKEEGLVDLKMKVFEGRDTSVDGVVLTLNNALNLRKAGKFKPTEIR